MSSLTTQVNESDFTCRTQTAFVNTVQLDPFETTLTVERMHAVTPRFGHSRDFSLLIEGSNDEQKDYLKGLLAASMAVFCLFVLWTLLLLVFKCFGPSKVGLFSALRPALPEKPSKPAIKKPKTKHKIPFQHNGIASGYDSPKSSPGKIKKTLKVTKAIAAAPIKAPKLAINKARQTKRSIEQNMDRRNKFERMGSDEDLDEHFAKDQAEQAPASPGSYGYSLGQSTVPTTPGTTDQADGLGASESKQLEDYNVVISKYEKELDDYRYQMQRHNTRIYRVRIMVGFSCLAIIITAVLFTVMGMDELDQSVQDTKAGLGQIANVANDAIDLIQTYQQRQQMSRNSTEKFLLQVNGT